MRGTQPADRAEREQSMSRGTLVMQCAQQVAAGLVPKNNTDAFDFLNWPILKTKRPVVTTEERGAQFEQGPLNASSPFSHPQRFFSSVLC